MSARHQFLAELFRLDHELFIGFDLTRLVSIV
jgi:hypothetical protein